MQPDCTITESSHLTLKVLITTASDNIFFYFYLYFSEKIRLVISCALSLEMQSLIFSEKIVIIKKLEWCLLKFCLAH